MFLSLTDVQYLIVLITFTLAYIISVTFAGAFRAWIAQKMGDDTAADEGFLTLNPLMHMDPIGMIFLLFFYFGWGRYIPINPFNITSHYRRIKQAFAYFSDVFAHIAIALIGLIILLALFDIKILHAIREMISDRAISYVSIAQAYPKQHSLAVSFGFICIAIIYLNVVLGVLNLIINSCSYFMLIAVERSPRFQAYNNYMVILIPMILIILFSGLLKSLVVDFIVYSGIIIAQFFGMLS